MVVVLPTVDTVKFLLHTQRNSSITRSIVLKRWDLRCELRLKTSWSMNSFFRFSNWAGLILLAFFSCLSLRYLPESPCWLDKYGSAKLTAILLHFLFLHRRILHNKYHNYTFSLCCYRALETHSMKIWEIRWSFGKSDSSTTSQCSGARSHNIFPNYFRLPLVRSLIRRKNISL